MSNSAGNAAFYTTGGPGDPGAEINLETARRMLPLVRHVVQDIRDHAGRLAAMQPERDQLDRQRRTLDWPDRSRRYQLRDQMADEQKHLDQAHAELESLGVVLIDPVACQVGFPTTVDGRRAYFSWRPGEADILYWHFEGEEVRRHIPSPWLSIGPPGLPHKGG